MRHPLVRVVGYRAPRTLRQRRSSLLAIVLLVGLLGGISLSAVAAARRTQSAFPAYLSATRASDLQFQAFDLTNFFGAGNNRLAGALASLPSVEHVAAAPTLLIVPRSAHRTNGPQLFGDVTLLGSEGGMYFTRDRVSVIQGRMADPHRLDEMVATAAAARILGWHLGESVPFNLFTVAQVAAAGNLPPGTDPPVARPSIRLVGLVEFASQVVRDDVDRLPTFVVFTPALTQRYASSGAIPTYGLRLAHGSRDVPAVQRAIVGLLAPGTVYNFHVTSVVEGQVLRASRPEAIAFGVFGIIAAIAMLLIAGQAIRRQAWVQRDDLDVLAALGADPATLAVDSILLPLAAVVLGSLLAVGVAVALSPLAPFGPVRAVYPTPGIALDWTVLAGGCCLFVVVLGVVAAGLPSARRRHRGRPEPVPRSSSVAAAATRTGLPAPAVLGLRFSLERGGGRSAAPVRSALLGAVLAVVVLVATATFASSLRTLDSHPALYGWNWDYAINSPSASNLPPVTARLLNKDHDVAAWTSYDLANAQLDGLVVPILLGDPRAELSPPILSGHALDATSQVVLGPATLAALHKKVGDTVYVSYGSRKDAPVWVPRTPLRIVGTATMPAIGSAGTLHPSVGIGALLSRGIEPPAFRNALTSSDPNQNGPGIDVVRLRGGLSTAAGLASVQRIADAATRVEDADPQGGGPPYQVLSVQRPAEIVIYQSTGATPLLLAAGLALGAITALGLTLAASVRRRRRELALLKTFGFTHRQLAATLAWQASVAAVVGIVVGVPVGIALGRWLWTLFANTISVVPVPAVPVAVIAAVAVGALVFANLAAIVPGREAARTPAALALRAE